MPEDTDPINIINRMKWALLNDPLYSMQIVKAAHSLSGSKDSLVSFDALLESDLPMSA
jgi:hypothetical protein